MSDNKKTFYQRNPARQEKEHRAPYRPQWEEMEVEPVPFPQFRVPATKNQSVPSMIFGQTKRGIPTPPNVGSIDTFQNFSPGQPEEREIMVPDFSQGFRGQQIDPNASMIDNNDFLSDAAMRQEGDWERESPRFHPNQGQVRVVDVPDVQSSDKDFDASSRMVREGKLPVEIPQRRTKVVSGGKNEMDDALFILNSLDPDQFFLFVKGKPLCSAPLKEIEEEINALIFGNHSLFEGERVEQEEILVVKKVPLKVGVFLDE